MDGKWRRRLRKAWRDGACGSRRQTSQDGQAERRRERRRTTARLTEAVARKFAAGDRRDRRSRRTGKWRRRLRKARRDGACGSRWRRSHPGTAAAPQIVPSPLLPLHGISLTREYQGLSHGEVTSENSFSFIKTSLSRYSLLSPLYRRERDRLP